MDRSKSYSDQLNVAYDQLLRQAWGKVFVWNLLEHAGVFRSSFTNGDPQATAFNEGARNQGLRLLNELLDRNPNVIGLLREEVAKYEGTND